MHIFWLKIVPILTLHIYFFNYCSNRRRILILINNQFKKNRIVIQLRDLIEEGLYLLSRQENNKFGDALRTGSNFGFALRITHAQSISGEKETLRYLGALFQRGDLRIPEFGLRLFKILLDSALLFENFLLESVKRILSDLRFRLSPKESFDPYPGFSLGEWLQSVSLPIFFSPCGSILYCIDRGTLNSLSKNGPFVQLGSSFYIFSAN